MEVTPAQSASTPATSPLTASTFEALIQLAPQAVMVTERYSSEILFMNNACRKLLGQNFVGRVIDDDYGLVQDMPLYPLADSGKIVERSTHPGEQLKRNGFIDKTEAKWLTPRGVLDIIISGSCLTEPVNGKYFCVYSLQDVTEMKASERKLRETLESQDLLIEDLRHKTDELNQGVESKQRLLSQLSHEVKNPLNIILGFSELLQESEEFNSAGTSEDIKNGIRAISRNANHILAVVEDQLARSTNEFKKISLDISAVPMDSLAQAMQISMGMLAARKGLRFQVNNQLTGTIIQTDIKLFRQVVTNLIGNAIKFTNQGEVTVNIMRNGTDRFCFEVRDTGAGISEENQKRLFEPFFQAHEDPLVRAQGTGLGLNIVRGIANQLGGSVQLVSSALNQGSIFRFEIPTRLESAGIS